MKPVLAAPARRARRGNYVMLLAAAVTVALGLGAFAIDIPYRLMSQGQAQGTQEGASAALGGFTQWDNGTFYVVTTAAGQQAEVPTVISSRVPMASNTYYSPCESDPTTLCTFPRPPADSSGSGGANADGGN